MAVDLASEFATPVKVVAPTATTQDSIDLTAEFEPPPRQERYAIINDAVDKAAIWKRAFDPAVPKEQQTEAAKKVLRGMLDSFGEKFTSMNKEEIVQQWETLNKPLVEIPLMPKESPSYQAAVYNGIAPIVSSFSSPLNLGTLGAFGALTKVAAGIGPAASAAKNALIAIKTAFAAQMARGTGEAAGEASVTAGKTPQQTTTEVTSALVQGALTALAGGSAVADVVATPGRAPAVNPKAVEEAIAKAPKVEPAAVAPETAAKVEPVDIGDRSGRPTGAAEEAVVAEQRKALGLDENNKPLVTPEAQPKPTLAEEFLPSEPVKPTDGGPTAVMNAVVDAERVKRGMEPAMEAEKRTDAAAWDTAMKTLDANPDAARTLVDEIKTEPRAINDLETALIRHRQITLQNRFDRTAADIVSAAEKGDSETVARLALERDAVSNDLLDVYNVGKLAGTETARGLRARRVMANEDYSLARMVTTRRAMNDGLALTPEQMSEVQQLHEKIASTQKAFDDYVTANKTKPGTSNTDRNVVSRFISEKADSARARIKARMAEGRVQSGLDPADLADHAIVGADYIAKGAEKFSDWSVEMVKEFGERVRPHLQAIFDKATEEVAAASSQRREEIRLKSFKTRTSNKAEELTEKTEAGDFTPRAKLAPLELDAEGNLLKAKLDAAREDYATALERDRYNKLTGLQKLKETAMHSYDMARLLMTTGEFSFILRQGKVGALAHPIITAKALPNAFRALVADPVASHALNLEIINHPDMPAARAAKLFLIEKGRSLSKQEEFLMAKWADKVPVVKQFNQAAETFLNKLRFDMWRAMRGTGGLTAAQDRQLAMFVNEATGRGGLGKLEVAAVPLGRAMFSPRFFASRLQLLAGHSLWGGDARTRKIIATEYARALVGLGAYYTALELSLGDDDKNKPVITTDPRSSDFGKVRFGNTRLDPLAGLSQVIVFSARTATGEKTSMKGKVSAIRGDKVPFGGDRWSDVATNFARSKLHPVPGAIVNLFDGTDLAGNKAEITTQALNLAAPITYMDIYQALEEQDLPDGVALGLLALLGDGLQTYETNRKKGKAAPIIEVPKPPPAPVSP